METDLTYLENMTEGDPGLISEMITIFSTQVKELSDLMFQYLEQKNWQELSRLAHKAKSSVAIMGMTGLVEKLKELEILAKKEKKTDTFAGYIEYFDRSSREAITELEAYMSTR